MSDNRDKPADPDPDATVSLPARKTAKPDDDATVMMPSRQALEKPDEDATVSMPRAKALEVPDADATVTHITRDAFKAPDDDSTVMMPPGGFKAEAAAETAAAIGSPTTPPAAFRTDADPEITAAGVPPPPAQILAAESSRIPMIAGGIVVVLVVLYFLMSGGEKAPGPVATKPGVTAPSPSSAAPAPPTASTPSPAASAPPPAAAPAKPASPSPAVASGGPSKVKELLAAEVKRGAIAVSEEAGGVTITIPGSQQFASGGIDPEPKLRPLLLAIGAALDKVPGAIVVTGHADATPSNNPKFPSNQELSAARAASAAKLIGSKLRDPKRIASEGASDSKPLAPGDTTENRAKNRRVAIVLKPAS